MGSSAARGATYYGVAMAVERIVRAIVRDEHSVLPVSNLLQGQYGIDGLCMSIPAVVGRNGVEDTLEIPLSPAEQGGPAGLRRHPAGAWWDSLERESETGPRNKAGPAPVPARGGDHQPGYPWALSEGQLS